MKHPLLFILLTLGALHAAGCQGADRADGVSATAAEPLSVFELIGRSIEPMVADPALSGALVSVNLDVRAGRVVGVIARFDRDADFDQIERVVARHYNGYQGRQRGDFTMALWRDQGRRIAVQLIRDESAGSDPRPQLIIVPFREDIEALLRNGRRP